jgi:hypothetical protein
MMTTRNAQPAASHRSLPATAAVWLGLAAAATFLVLAPWQGALAAGSLAAALGLAGRRRAGRAAAGPIADAPVSSAGPDMHPLSIEQVETVLDHPAPRTPIGETDVAELARRLAEALRRRGNGVVMSQTAALPISAEPDDDDEDFEPTGAREAVGPAAAPAPTTERAGETEYAAPVVIFAARMAGTAPAPLPAPAIPSDQTPHAWDPDDAARALENALATLRRSCG